MTKIQRQAIVSIGARYLARAAAHRIAHFEPTSHPMAQGYAYGQMNAALADYATIKRVLEEYGKKED